MSTELFIPKLGQTVEEVKMMNWLVQDGAKVDFGTPVLDVETDKAVFSVEANAKGYIHIGPHKEGETLPVLTVVAIIGKAEDTFVVAGAPAPVEEAAPAAPAPAEAPAAEKAADAAGDGGKVFASPRARKLADAEGVNLAQVTATGYNGERVVERDVVAYLNELPKLSPVAQKMAEEAGLDIRGLEGSGPRGRVVKADVQRALDERQGAKIAAAAPAAPIAAAPAAKTAPPAAPAPLPVADVTERIPLKGVRAIIADRMATSVHTTARVTLMIEVDATEFVAARTRLKEKVSEEWGYTPGFNDLLAKIVATALRKFPYMNARLAPDAIELLGHVNVGMAVDTERGLLVTVIKDADRKNVREFGAEFRQLVDRARLGRSLPDDLTGGSFTITNLGMFDIDAFTPVINLPEAAILGVGRIAAKPVVRANAVEIRQMWTLSLVFDHRLVDGAPAARFLQYIKQMIEEPYMLLGA